MLLFYNEENMKKVIDLFSDDKIVAIDVDNNNSSNEYAFNITLIDDCNDDEKINLIRRVRNKFMFNQRLNSLGLLKEFSKQMEKGKVTEFFLQYDLSIGLFNWRKSFEEDQSKEEKPDNDLDLVLKSLKQITQDLGIGEKELPSLNIKIKPEGAKRYKYIAAKVNDLISELEDITVDKKS